MKNFEFVNAPTLPEALQALDTLGEKALLVAGGTDVMVQIRAGKRNDRTLANIRDIKELRGISLTGGVVTVGALTVINDLGASEILKQYAPGLYAVGHVFADPTTRNSATIGGNVSTAVASGDTIPSLLALDAVAHIQSLHGSREVKVCDLFARPGRTVMQPNEMLTHLTFAAEPHMGFLKLSMRNAMSISMATCAAYVKLSDDGVVEACRIGLGSVAPTPVRAYSAEKALIGKKLEDSAFAQAGEAVQADINPRNPSVRATASYRRAVVPVLVKRACKLAAFGDCK